MAELRSKLFLSYSHRDTVWRDRFCDQLRSLFSSDLLWVDAASIKGGADWSEKIDEALATTRCALLLLTPSYLDYEGYSRQELLRLIDAQSSGLKLLPVLVKECAWGTIASLSAVQFLRWRGGTRLIAGSDGAHEELMPLDEDPHPDHAIVDLCQQVVKEHGYVGQTTPQQIADLAQGVKEVVRALDNAAQRGPIDDLAKGVKGLLGHDLQVEAAVHSGDFSVVYRARMGDETVAVKAISDRARQNRIRSIFRTALQALQQLRDPVFIRVRLAYTDRDPQCLVMDYINWPTLETRLASMPGRCLPPRVVARVLWQVARAQREAHEYMLQIGPLSLASIHVDDDWNVRLSALRVEGVLARVANMATGQLLNWEALTHLAPETSGGVQPETRADLDALEQYYLGLLGLQLLQGRPACEIRSFDDLMGKVQFFDDPRGFFGRQAEAGEAAWTRACPGLAYVLSKLLARRPQDRLPNADAVVADLGSVAKGHLPSCVRKQLDEDLDELMKPEFAAGFYARLFEGRESLQKKFKSSPQVQARMLSDALQDIVAFDPGGSSRSRFAAIAKRHAGYDIGLDDVKAFRAVFVKQVKATFGGSEMHADAWDAALEVCTGQLMQHLPS